MHVHTFIARGLALVFLSTLGPEMFGGQDASRSNIPVSPGVYHSDTKIVVQSDLVVIPVTVTDDRGRVVAGLEKEHFTLFEDDARQEITHFSFEDTPVSIGIVFDTSGSMEPKMDKARQAVNNLLRNANRNDEFFLVKFSTRARVVVPWTSRFDEIRRGVELLDVGGLTALLDGVRLAMDEMKHARYSRKALIIISDGEDNSSHWTVGELKAAAREQDILMYAIGIPDPSDRYVTSWPPQPRGRGQALLNEIATQTGGQLFEVKKPKQLPEIAARIGGCLRIQYMLGYKSSRSEKDGTYRQVRLDVAPPKGYPRLHTVWRQGYYAPKE
jgi:Ca-activated chloride channel homolog